MADALHTPGVVTAAEARLDDAGLIAVQGPTALDARTGVLFGPGTTTLVTGTSSTAPMQYAIAPHHWVTNRGVTTDGVYRGTNEAVQLVSTTAAPGSGSRIDVIYEKQGDTASTLTPDATTAPVYGVVQGTSTTGTPTKPAIPVGALELGTATVAAGATATNGSGVVITNTARQTVARGAPIPVGSQSERAALTVFPGLEVKRLDLNPIRIERWSGSSWVRLEGVGPNLRPVVNGAGGGISAPGPVTAHGAITIDPTALFGAGYGAIVNIDARVLGDCPSGFWDLDIVSPALSATVLTKDSRLFAGRNTLAVFDTADVQPGTTRSFSTRLVNGSATLTTFLDPTNNRAKYTVHPYLL